MNLESSGLFQSVSKRLVVAWVKAVSRHCPWDPKVSILKTTAVGGPQSSPGPSSPGRGSEVSPHPRRVIGPALALRCRHPAEDRAEPATLRPDRRGRPGRKRQVPRQARVGRFGVTRGRARGAGPLGAAGTLAPHLRCPTQPGAGRRGGGRGGGGARGAQWSWGASRDATPAGHAAPRRKGRRRWETGSPRDSKPARPKAKDGAGSTDAAYTRWAERPRGREGSTSGKVSLPDDHFPAAARRAGKLELPPPVAPQRLRSSPACSWGSPPSAPTARPNRVSGLPHPPSGCPTLSFSPLFGGRRPGEPRGPSFPSDGKRLTVK